MYLRDVGLEIHGNTGFTLLYIDFSFSEIGVRSVFHRLIFFWLVPQPSRFLTRGFGVKTWDCILR